MVIIPNPGNEYKYLFWNSKNTEAKKVVEEGMKEFSDLDIIIVDTAGRHALDGDLIDEMKQVSKVFKPDEIFPCYGRYSWTTSWSSSSSFS